MMMMMMMMMSTAKDGLKNLAFSMTPSIAVDRAIDLRRRRSTVADRSRPPSTTNIGSPSTAVDGVSENATLLFDSLCKWSL